MILKQLHLGDWQHGLAAMIAFVSVEPAELTRRTGLIFEVTRDDLDYLSASLLELPSGRQAALARHHHTPEAGTEIVLNERSDHMASDLALLLRELKITPAEVTWVHPDVQKLAT